MIPISLTIKGLFSYQSEQTIYFDRLIAGQLFGIFGPVGSGKSSILEAIAFALYGETERLHIRDDRNYNMMNLKSNELLIDFVFQNFDDVQYRFVVKGKRHGKKFNQVNTFERRSYQLIKGAWEPLLSTTAEEILGLSYENFRRTIIIPQGKFQEFLQLTDKARTDMLKDIFQLDRFEFFQQATALERKNNESIQLLKGRLLAFEEVNDEQLNALSLRLGEMEQALEANKQALQREEHLLKEQEQLGLLFRELHLLGQRHQVLTEQLIQYNQMKKELEDMAYCERHFKTDLLRLDELGLGIDKRKVSLVEYEQQLNICNTQLMKLLQDQARITIAVKQLEDLKDKRQDYNYGIKLLELDAAINKLDERIEKGRIFVEKAQGDKLNGEKRVAQLKEEVQRKKQEKPAIGRLTELRAWFKQFEYLRESAQAKSREQQAIQQELDEQYTFVQQAKDEAGLENGDTLTLRLEEREKKLTHLQKQINHIQWQLKLSDFTAALHRGEACPLCGSQDHPHILILEDVQDELIQLQKDQANLQIQQKNDQALERQLALVQAKIADLRKRKAQLDEQYQAQADAVQQHELAFMWPDYQITDSEKVEQQLRDLEQMEAHIEQLEKQVSAEEEMVRKAETARDQYDEGLRKLMAERQQHQGAFQSLSSQLKTLTLNEIKNTDSPNIFEQAVSQIDAHIHEVTQQNEAIQQALHTQQQLKTTLEERLNAIRDNIEAEAERLQFINDKLSATLQQQSRFKDLDEVRAILANDWDVEKVKQEVAQFDQELYHVKEQMDQLATQTAGKTFNEAHFEELQAAYNKRKSEQEAEYARYLAEKSHRQRLLKQQEEKAQLNKALAALTSRSEHIGLLKNMFKGSGFVSFISSVYLRQLCEAANKRFYKLTRQQLKLELTERNEFQVRDYLNDGKVRLAKTLSGGQTFQASLSLALALAESVQQQNKAKQNFFFLDEGFGSLDKDSLNIAFDTLKSLRKEHRIVGIISHVEELQQEIDVFLKIQNDTMLGTKVTGNWEA